MDPVRLDVDDLARRCGDRELADPESFPRENIRELHQSGFIRGPLSVAMGGAGWTLQEAVAATEKLAAAASSTALISVMPLGLAGIYGHGPAIAPPDYRAAWADQVERVAADFRSGRLYAAANSEKGAGGSLASTKTTAGLDPERRFRLNGEKILASGGKYADVFFSTAKVRHEDLPGCGTVEFFFVDSHSPGVEVISDWDGFGMRSTESHTVRYVDAASQSIMGFPGFIDTVRPLQYWFCLFAAIPLGCVRRLLATLGTPAPTSPALRFRLNEALMRYESLRSYLLETAGKWQVAAGPEYAARTLRTKTWVTQESTRLCADLFALSGGRHYRRNDALARALADSFAGTALRPPLPLALDALMENFSLGDLDGEP